MIQQLDAAWARVYMVARDSSIEATYQKEIASISPDEWDSLLS